MYIRTKVAKGRTYYQLVEGRRIGGKVRQRIVAALGQHPTIEAALTDWKRQLTRLRRVRGRLLAIPNPGKALATRLARLEANIANQAARVELLTKILKQGNVAPSRTVVPTSDSLPGPKPEDSEAGE